MDSPIFCVETGLRDLARRRPWNKKGSYPPQEYFTYWLDNSIMCSIRLLSISTALLSLYGCPVWDTACLEGEFLVCWRRNARTPWTTVQGLSCSSIQPTCACTVIFVHLVIFCPGVFSNEVAPRADTHAATKWISGKPCNLDNLSYSKLLFQELPAQMVDFGGRIDVSRSRTCETSEWARWRLRRK